MADISQVKLPDNQVYDISDDLARERLATIEGKLNKELTTLEEATATTNNSDLVGAGVMQDLLGNSGITGFGVDSNGRVGYYKDGADTVTPFNSRPDWVLLYENLDLTNQSTGTTLSTPGIQNYKYLACEMVANTSTTNGRNQPQGIGISPIRSNGGVTLYAISNITNANSIATSGSSIYGWCCIRNCVVTDDYIKLGYGYHLAPGSGDTTGGAIIKRIWGIEDAAIPECIGENWYGV